MVDIIYVGLGFMMLIAGRPLYYVFVGGIGCLVGVFLADKVFLFPPDVNAVAMPLILAAIGVLGALGFRRFAAGVAGFIAGGLLLNNLPYALGGQVQPVSPINFILAGAVATAMLIIIFDFAMIIISSITAVTYILGSMHLGNLDQGAMFLILTVFGIITQYLILQYGKPSPD